ncbi:MAG: benzoate/H(+) symporter BenE family transporter, partial [Desulfomonilaceae bacterium]
AICSSPAAHEKHELRYVAAFYEGVFWFCFALLAKTAVEAVNMVPKEFVIVLAGIAMFDVFSTAFRGAFSGKFRYGAIVAFFIAVANLPILTVGAPLWAIIFGVAISLALERDDFKNNNNSASPAETSTVPYAAGK